jgi:sugar lactone lactonase YvrE
VPAAALRSTPRCELGESPRWDARSGRLYWIDIPAGAVHRVDPIRGTVTTRSIGQLVSAIVPYADRWLIGVESGAQVRDREFTLVEEVVLPVPTAVRMNDGAVDRSGRFFLGSLATDDRAGAGQLFRIDPDGGVTCVLSGLDTSNGICWSPDGTRMFHTDSGTRVIRAYAYDESTGSMGAGEVFYQHPDDGAVPDGITVDADGTLWVALWDGARIIHLDASGRITEEVPVEAQRPTSVAFGGDGLSTLFITSAAGGVPSPGDGDGRVHTFRPRRPGLAQNSVSTTPVTWSSSSSRKTAR